MQAALDFLHRHKTLTGAIVVGLAYALRFAGYHEAYEGVLTVAALIGIGKPLPNGPGFEPISKR